MLITIGRVNVLVWCRWALELTSPGLWPRSHVAAGAGHDWPGRLHSLQYGISSSTRLHWASSYVNRNIPKGQAQMCKHLLPLLASYLLMSHWPKQVLQPRPQSLWVGATRKHGPRVVLRIQDHHYNDLSQPLRCSHKEGFYMASTSLSFGRHHFQPRLQSRSFSFS